MYLSVPLPRALERHLEVIFVPAAVEKGPSRHQLVLQQYDDISKLRQMLVKLLELDEEQSSRLILAEVANRVIVRFLEDQLLLRNLSDGQHRSVYAFEVPPLAQSLTSPELSSGDKGVASLSSISNTSVYLYVKWNI